MDALGIADASIVADCRRRQRLVHGAARAPRRPQRHRLRAGRAAGDAGRDHTPRAARRADQRAAGARARAAIPLCRAMRKLDAILMVGVYHEIEDRVTMLKNLAAALKPQGRIGVIEFKLERRRRAGPGGRRTRRSADRDDATRPARGCGCCRRRSFLPYQYLSDLRSEHGTCSERRPADEPQTDHARQRSRRASPDARQDRAGQRDLDQIRER